MANDNHPTPDSGSLLQPWERGEPEESVEDRLFSALDSDPEFLDPDKSEDADEPASDEDDTDSDDPEEDDEDGDDDEEGSEEESEDDDDDEDDDSEEDEDDEDGDEEDEDQDDETLYDVKYKDETLKVNLQELKEGYSRTEDYTRKRQADAEEHATELTQTRQARDQYANGLDKLKQAMEFLHTEPDWDKLRKESPAEYAAQKADYAERQAAIERIGTERARVDEEVNEESLTAQNEYIQGQIEHLIIAVPEWDNATTRQSGLAELRGFAHKAYGFSDEELDQVIDHRLLLLLRENMVARKATKAGKKEIRRKSKGKPKLKPGGARRKTSRKNRGKKKAGDRARERLAHSGSVDDAAAAFLHYLEDEEA